jgi:hypothetical protein
LLASGLSCGSRIAVRSQTKENIVLALESLAGPDGCEVADVMDFCERILSRAQITLVRRYGRPVVHVQATPADVLAIKIPEKYEAADIALWTSRAELRRLRDVTATDLLALGRGELAPAIDQYFAHFDAMVSFIAHSILKGSDIEQRRRRCGFWIEVLTKAFSSELTSFQLILEIWTAEGLTEWTRLFWRPDWSCSVESRRRFRSWRIRTKTFATSITKSKIFRQIESAERSRSSYRYSSVFLMVRVHRTASRASASNLDRIAKEYKWCELIIAGKRNVQPS